MLENLNIAKRECYLNTLEIYHTYKNSKQEQLNKAYGHIHNLLYDVHTYYTALPTQIHAYVEH